MASIQIAHSVVAGHVPILTLPGQVAVNEADGIFYIRDSGGNVTPMYAGMPGMLWGLGLAPNGGSPTTSVDIAAGTCATGTAPYLTMTLGSVLTKNVTSSWAVGSGAGGLDTGVVGNNTYHVFLIRRPDTGVVDGLFSLSPTAPTMPPSYTQKRRLGSIMRVAAANVSFTQFGDEFLLSVPVNAYSTNLTGGTSVLVTLTVPTGIQVLAKIALSTDATVDYAVLLTSPDQTDSAPARGSIYTIQNMITSSAQTYGSQLVRTNTLAQIRVRGTNTTIEIGMSLSGWFDRRGRDGGP